MDRLVKLIIFTFFLSCVCGAVQARGELTGKLVEKITIKGNRKIESDAIKARVKSKVGGVYSLKTIKEDLHSIYSSGYFYDIEISKFPAPKGGLELVYKVQEKPSVVEYLFEGNTELDDEELQETVELKAYEILDMDKISEAEEKIQKAYEDKGYFLAQVDSQVEEIKKDESVRVLFRVQENDKIQVKKITFLGNRQLKDRYLKGKMITEEGTFFSSLSGAGSYKQEAFDRDVQMLRYLYFNQGYVQVKIDRPQVYVSPDKKGIFITIRIEEGDQFDVGEVDFTGDLLFSREELFETSQIDEEKVFAYEILQKDLGSIQAKYGDLGYAYANIIPRTRINEKERKVDITFEIEKGNKVYFGRINVVGNSKTRDKVVRRELRILEGELYNETRKRESIENVKRLGYFDEVNFKTSSDENNQDIMNIDIVVKERNTGSIQVGAGYGSATGTTFQGQVSQSNFLGYGQKLSVSLLSNSTTTRYNFNFTEPYFLDTRWSLGFDVFQSISNRGDYIDESKGGAVRVGHPLAPYLKGWVKLKNEFSKIDLDNDELSDIFPTETTNGVTNSVTFTVQYDRRNDRFSPSKGKFFTTSLEYAGIGGDIRYTKGHASFQYFKKLFWNVVLRNHLSYSFIQAHDNCKAPVNRNGVETCEPPFNELFLLGGPYSLRGYSYPTVGKRIFSQGLFDEKLAAWREAHPGQADPEVGSDDYEALKRSATVAFGGQKQILYTAELEFPLIEEAKIKGVVFYDIGQAEDVIDPEKYKADVGFGFRWFSPIGPLRFEWGFPLNRDKFLNTAMNFDFSIGSPF